MEHDFFQHPLAVVESEAIGRGTRIWAFAHILPDVRIGANCNICDHAYLEHGVTIGNNVTIKNGAFIPSGVVLEDDVFIGPYTTFTNDRVPRSKQPMEFQPTLVKAGASIGANCTILCGIEIGREAMVGAGSVVTRSVPDHMLAYGNPAKCHGSAPRSGERPSV